MGQLLLVTVVTSFTPHEMRYELARTSNAELLTQERFPAPCPAYLERFGLLLDVDEVGYLVHFAVRVAEPVVGDGPIAYSLERRRLAALQIAGS